MALQAQPNPYWQPPSLTLANGAMGPQLASSVRVANSTGPVVKFGETTELSQETTFTKLPKSLQIWVKEGSLAAYALGAKTMLPEHLLLGIVRLAQEGFKKEYYKIEHESDPGVAKPYLATDEGRAQKHALLALFPDIAQNDQLKRTFYARTQYIELQLRRSLSDKVPEPSKIFGLIPRRGIGEEFGPSKILQTLRPVSRASGNVFESIFRFFSRLLNPTIELKLAWDKTTQETLKQYVDSSSNPDERIILRLSDNLREVPRNNLRLALDEDHAFKIDLNGDLEETTGTSEAADRYRKLQALLDSKAGQGVMKPEQREAIQSIINRFKPSPDNPVGAMAREFDNQKIIERLDFVLNRLPWKREGLNVPGLAIKDDAEASKVFRDSLRATLDEQLYGMKPVKDKVIDLAYTNVFYRQRLNQKNPSVRATLTDTNKTPGYRLLLSGPPGVGKSSIAKSIAKAMNRGYGEVHLGTVSVRNDLTGFSQTYQEAQAGAIIKAIVDSKCANPVILLDEVDKLANSASQQFGNPMEALQQILTDVSNEIYKDNYVGIPYDLSEVVFVLTANDTSRLTDPLMDRLDKVYVPGYDITEKIQIAKKLVAKIYKDLNITKDDQLVFFNDPQNDNDTENKAIEALIQAATLEAGVRDLDRVLRLIITNWIANRHIDGSFANSVKKRTSDNSKFTAQDINQWLEAIGVQPIRASYLEKASPYDMVGRINGLVYNSDMIGGIAKLDAKTYKYTLPTQGLQYLPTISFEDNTFNNQVGDSFKESMVNALNWYKSNAIKLDLDYPTMTRNFTEHWRVTLGQKNAGPADGPSGGAAMTLLLISTLNNMPLKGHFALTGTINLQGEIGRIDGVKEKVMNAVLAGATEIALPKENAVDMLDLPDWVFEKLDRLIFPETIYDLLDHAFTEHKAFLAGSSQLQKLQNKLKELRENGQVRQRGFVMTKTGQVPVTRENLRQFINGTLPYLNNHEQLGYRNYIEAKNPFNDAVATPESFDRTVKTILPNISADMAKAFEQGQNPFAQPVYFVTRDGQSPIPVTISRNGGSSTPVETTTTS
jgi:ATP-dependent Lon protease